jgi:ribonuclease-3
MTAPQTEELRLQDVEEKIGYTFNDPDLLVHALTHSSAKTKERPCNERLEFLGDAILGLVVSESLYESHPDFTEGDLSMIKSVVVSATSLEDGIRHLGIESHILTGKGLRRRPKLPRSVLSNVFEAIVAAIYRDGGYDPARKFVIHVLESKVHDVLNNSHEKNYKSILQDHAQRNSGAIPRYNVIEETGPDHNKRFLIRATVNDDTYPAAWGTSKKEAEQKAAHLALVELGLEEPNGDCGEE